MRSIDLLVRYLAEQEVTHLFGMSGANIEDIYDALYHYNGGIKGIIAKHEFAAACMACGYHRVTNRMGVVASTSGGAVFNLVPALGEAYTVQDSILAIIGQPPAALAGTGVFQDTSGLNGSVDAYSLLSGVARFIAKPTHQDEIIALSERAIHTACTHPAGPALLLLPKDLQQAHVADESLPVTKANVAATIMPSATHELILNHLLPLFTELNVPTVCLIIGREAIKTNSKNLIGQLVKLLGAQVAVAADAKAAFDNNDPHFAGVIGIGAHAGVREAIKQADIILVLGARLAALEIFDVKNLLINKDIFYIGKQSLFNRDELAKKNQLIIHNTDISIWTQYFIGQLKNRVQQMHAVPNKNALSLLPALSFEVINAFNSTSILALFNRYLESDAQVFVDAGNSGAMVVHYLAAPVHGYFDIALGLGGMGFMIGAGIGAAFATGKRTYIFLGDGSFLMHGLELHTAIEYNLPIVFVIFNNNAHAMCYTREQLYYAGDYSYNKFKPSVYGQGLRAMFPSLALAVDIDDLNTLEHCLVSLKKISGPVVLSLNIAVEELPNFSPLLQQFNLTRR